MAARKKVAKKSARRPAKKRVASKRSKKWIQSALGVRPRRLGRGPHHKKAVRVAAEHPGALHRALHVPAGKKIPLALERKAARAPGKLGHRARLALTLRKLSSKRKSPTKRRRS